MGVPTSEKRYPCTMLDGPRFPKSLKIRFWQIGIDSLIAVLEDDGLISIRLIPG